MSDTLIRQPAWGLGENLPFPSSVAYLTRFVARYIMEEFENVPLEIQTSDLMEQIVRVNHMIELHTDDAFMQAQYRALRKDFVDQLNALLQSVHLKLTEVAA